MVVAQQPQSVSWSLLVDDVLDAFGFILLELDVDDVLDVFGSIILEQLMGLSIELISIVVFN